MLTKKDKKKMAKLLEDVEERKAIYLKARKKFVKGK